MRFAEGHLPLGKTIVDTTSRPASTKFTLVKNWFAIGHIDLCPKFLARELKSFYRKLEYPSAYYALLKPGVDPKYLQKKIVSGEIKLQLLSDILKKAPWSKRHLIWFESTEEHANYRVSRSTIAKDTIAVIQGVMEC